MSDMQRLIRVFDKLMSHDVPKKDAIAIARDPKLKTPTRYSYLSRLYEAISGGEKTDGVDMEELCRRIRETAN